MLYKTLVITGICMRFAQLSYCLIFVCCLSFLHFFFQVPRVEHNRRKQISIREKQEQLAHRHDASIQLVVKHEPNHVTQLVIAPDTVLHKPSTPTSDPLVFLGFPFLHELDILHLKMQLLSSAVDYFVVSEACYNLRGHRKPLFFNLSKHESRFAQFSRKIWHIIDCRVPQYTDEALGWAQLDQAKINIGLAFLAHPGLHNRSKVVIGDSDESPSLSSLLWLKSQDMGIGTTYEFRSTMPHYIYGFQWRVRPHGYSTMTARSMLFEKMFWTAKFTGTSLDQNVLPIPKDIAEGSWHCSYCVSDAECIVKMKAALAVDGPLILGNYDWSEQTVRALKGCGVSPQGDQCELVPLNITVAHMYTYLVDMPECTSFQLPFRS